MEKLTGNSFEKSMVDINDLMVLDKMNPIERFEILSTKEEKELMDICNY